MPIQARDLAFLRAGSDCIDRVSRAAAPRQRV